MAPFNSFISGSYRSRAFQADAERSINYFPETVESASGQTKTSTVLLVKPGLVGFARDSAASAVRAEAQLNGRAFSVMVRGSSNVLYETFADGSLTNRGTLPGGRVQLVPSQFQMLILAGGLGFGFDFRTNALTRITADAFPIGATKAGVLDGTFLVLEPKSQVFAYSGVNDLFTWDPLAFEDVEGEPGNVVTFLINQRQIWFLGVNHLEVFVDSGNLDVPFIRLEGAYAEIGSESTSIDAAFLCDNTIYWLGANGQGGGVFYRANGYRPERVSTYWIEQLLKNGGDLSKVTGYGYQEGGHTFARWDIPGANGGRGASVLYDPNEKRWHERYFWNARLGQYMGDLARTHMFAFGKHLVGDWRSGTIYEQSLDYATDAGAAIRRLRASPDLANGGKWTFYDEFTLLMDVGIGLDGPPEPPPLPVNTYLGALLTGSTLTPGTNRTITLAGDQTVPAPPNFTQVLAFSLYLLRLTAFDGASPEPVGTVGTWTGTLQAGAGAVLPYSQTISGQAIQILLFQPQLPAAAADALKLSLTSASTTPPLTTPTLQFEWFMAASAVPKSMFLTPLAATNGAVIATAPLSFTQAVVKLLWATNNGPSGLYEAIPPGSSVTVTLTPAGGSASAPVVLSDANPVAIVPFSTVPFSAAPGDAACAFTSTALVAGGGGFALLSIELTGPGGLPIDPFFPNDGAPAGDGVNPVMIFQVSNDGGKTWSPERPAPIGAIGQFQQLVQWRRCGRSNNRAFRVICTEPIREGLVAVDLVAHG